MAERFAEVLVKRLVERKFIELRGDATVSPNGGPESNG